MLGEMAGETILASQRLVPGRLLATGYTFKWPALEPALRHLLSA
jgi:NAD dependent epimerase/dehydratase family enzyme